MLANFLYFYCLPASGMMFVLALVCTIKLGRVISSNHSSDNVRLILVPVPPFI